MFRLIFYLLIIVVVFLIGLSIGLDRQAVKEPFKEENIPIEIEHFSQDEKKIIEQPNNEQYLIYEGHLEKEEHFTHKIANTLESLVSAFYKLIIDILYYFARLFL